MKTIGGITLLLLTMLTLVGCPAIVPDVDTTKFQDQTDDFVKDLGLPMKADTITTSSEINSTNLKSEAKRIVEDMVSVDFKSSPNTVTKLKEIATPKIIDSITDSFLAYGFLEEGDAIVNVQWVTDDGTAFTSLGVQDAKGTPKYESMMYFNTKDSSPEPSKAVKGSWTWGPFTNVRVNGFGSECVRVEWTVKIQTSDCFITDPAPHIEITKEGANCWLWEQKTTKGELAYCSPEEQCVCSKDEVNKEDCIKWAVVNYWANGFSKIKVEAGAKGKVSGIDLEAKVSLEGGRIGIAKKRETIRNLCAKTGDAKN